MHKVSTIDSLYLTKHLLPLAINELANSNLDIQKIAL